MANVTYNPNTTTTITTTTSGYPFFVVNLGGDFINANDISYHIIVPDGLTTISKLYVTCNTAPTNGSQTVKVFNITQNASVGNITIPSGAKSATVSISASVNAGDILRLDNVVTNGTAASNGIVAMSS